jgi:hypothetical protein
MVSFCALLRLVLVCLSFPGGFLRGTGGLTTVTKEATTGERLCEAMWEKIHPHPNHSRSSRTSAISRRPRVSVMASAFSRGI